MLYATCYMLYDTCYMLYAKLFTLKPLIKLITAMEWLDHVQYHATCYMLHVTCYMLYATLFTLRPLIKLINAMEWSAVCNQCNTPPLLQSQPFAFTHMQENVESNVAGAATERVESMECNLLLCLALCGSNALLASQTGWSQHNYFCSNDFSVKGHT